MTQTSTLRITALCTLAAASALLAGCGGGGGGGPQNKTLVGTLLNFLNAPQPGDTVIYDQGTTGSQTTVTDAHGQYRLVLPLSAITGSDTLSFYDSAGHLLDRVPVTLPQNTASISLTTVAPPPPPGP